MAYLTRKRIKGITYYYAEESERVNGKPKRKWQKSGREKLALLRTRGSETAL